MIAGVGGAIGYVPGPASAANIGRGVVAGFAGDLANAATRSLVEGSDFGDNVLAGLPDVIAQTIGNVISGALARSRTEKIAAIPKAKREELDSLGIPTTVGRDGSVTTDLSPAEIAKRVAAARAAGVNIEIGSDDDIVVGVSRSASQKVTKPNGSTAFINYLGDPGLTATYKSIYVGSRQLGATRFITNAQGETYLYDGSQTRIDGLGLSISYSDAV